MLGRGAPLIVGLVCLIQSFGDGQNTSKTVAHTLMSLDGLTLHKVEGAVVEYKGRNSVRLTEVPGAQEEDTLAILTASDFADGVIDVDLAGLPGRGASETARGFVGVAFRVRREPLRFECIYLRPANARAEDQLRRNRSTQYVSHPEFPWHRLRRESPGVYESYADLESGAWTKVRIAVRGTEARLYVHGAEQPCLIVKGLKLGAGRGAVALWIGPGTEAHFSNLIITPDG